MPLVIATLFLNPIPVEGFWLLLIIPLALAVSVVYKAIRVDELRELPRQAAWLTAQIVFFMVLAAGALWVITELA